MPISENTQCAISQLVQVLTCKMLPVSCLAVRVSLFVLVCCRRQVRRSKSMISVILFGDETSTDDVKTKNIRQTGEFGSEEQHI